MRKQPELRVRWSRRERALVYHAVGPTDGLVSYQFETLPTTQGKSPIAEARGYDITTLRLSVRKKAES